MHTKMGAGRGARRGGVFSRHQHFPFLLLLFVSIRDSPVYPTASNPRRKHCRIHFLHPHERNHSSGIFLSYTNALQGVLMDGHHNGAALQHCPRVPHFRASPAYIIRDLPHDRVERNG